MLKKYFYIIAVLICFCSTTASGQENKQPRVVESSVEGLSFYPNPVSNGKIYITSKSSDDKEITIYDVLGKKVLQAILSTRELNIASISPGVYIIKIREGEASSTRKLIIK